MPRILTYNVHGCIGTDGEYFGQPIILDPGWQALLWILYGWKRSVEIERKGKKVRRLVRRFKIAYAEMGAGDIKDRSTRGLPDTIHSASNSPSAGAIDRPPTQQPPTTYRP